MEIDEILEKIKDNIIDTTLMKLAANQGLAIIRARTNKGEFLEGSSSGADQYSTKALPLPLSLFAKLTRQSLQSKKMNKIKSSAGDYTIFTSKSGNLWIVITGGYKKVRELSGKDTSIVSMQWSGRMMRNLGIVNLEARQSTLGFSSKDEQQKAIWHNVMGAGRSKRKHVFMDFSKEELKILSDLISESAAKKLLQVLK